MKKENVLITGSTGFIGSHLTQSLQSSANVYLALRKDSMSGFWRIPNIQDFKTVSLEEIRNGSCKKTRQGEDLPVFDCVYHLASPSNIYKNDTEKTLVDGCLQLTLDMITFCSEQSAKKLVVAGTAAEYGRITSENYTEKSNIEPTSMYGSAKAATNTMAITLADKLQVPLVIARFFSVYGPADKPKNIIPAMIQAICTDVPIDLTPGEQIRDFIYIDDVIQALHAFLSYTPSKYDIFNVSTGKGTNLLNIATILQSLNGNAHKLFRFGPGPHGR